MDPYSVRPHGPIVCEDLIKQNKGESRYSTRLIVLIKSATVTDRIQTCAIFNLDPKSNDLDRSAIGTPTYFIVMLGCNTYSPTSKSLRSLRSSQKDVSNVLYLVEDESLECHLLLETLMEIVYHPYPSVDYQCKEFLVYMCLLTVTSGLKEKCVAAVNWATLRPAGNTTLNEILVLISTFCVSCNNGAPDPASSIDSRKCVHSYFHCQTVAASRKLMTRRSSLPFLPLPFIGWTLRTGKCRMYHILEVLNTILYRVNKRQDSPSSIFF
ncbi:hypothetical protein J6590_062817 [Homalodisca vitripennis]|nr:hypothetical protein J6590_062817 [Homalodisca vitripennis]